MAEPPSHYELLEIPPSADARQVRLAYRRLAQRWHPDRHGGSAASTARFVRVRQAFEVLSDPIRRRQYDEGLRQAGKGPSPSPSASPPPPPEASVPRAESLALCPQVALEALVRGGEIRVSGYVVVPCSRCQGGCGYCRGHGQVWKERVWVVDVPPGQGPTEWVCLRGAGHVSARCPLPGDVFFLFMPRSAHGWHWNFLRQRLERTIRVPRKFLSEGGRLEFVGPHGGCGHVRVPPSSGKRQWLFVAGPGLGAPGPVGAWVEIKVGLGFSWGARRLDEV